MLQLIWFSFEEYINDLCRKKQYKITCSYDMCLVHEHRKNYPVFKEFIISQLLPGSIGIPWQRTKQPNQQSSPKCVQRNISR